MINKHLVYIEKKVADLRGVDDPVDMLLEIDGVVATMNQDQVRDLIMYLLGRIHDAENKD